MHSFNSVPCDGSPSQTGPLVTPANRLYAWLLRLHPAGFRERFAAEMMLNFEEVRTSGAPASLFGDALCSLLRQWLVRSGSWKVAAAAVGATLQLAALAALWFRAN